MSGGRQFRVFEAKDVATLAEAAGRGDAEAAFQLGRVYDHGFGLPRDPVRAAAWYRAAALAGHPEAQHNLGALCFSGDGVAVDAVEAVHWWRLAAAQGTGYSQIALGTAYFWGRGVPFDPVEAYAWFAVGTESARGDPEAVQWGQVRDGLARFFSPAQRAEGERRAEELRAETRGGSDGAPPESQAGGGAR